MQFLFSCRGREIKFLNVQIEFMLYAISHRTFDVLRVLLFFIGTVRFCEYCTVRRCTLDRLVASGIAAYAWRFFLIAAGHTCCVEFFAAWHSVPHHGRTSTHSFFSVLQPCFLQYSPYRPAVIQASGQSYGAGNICMGCIPFAPAAG